MFSRAFIASMMFVLFRSTTSCHRKTMINGHGVTEGDKNMILDYHNRMRQAVAMGTVAGQPPAANMMELKWDVELAQRAQKWSTSCGAEGHDPGRHTTRFDVGQNIATMWTRASPRNTYDMMANFASAIGKWFDEYRNFRFGPVGGYAKNTGHYTQMVWGATDLIGCGFSYYYDVAKGFTKNYVCNYGASGNVLGEEPYVKGRPSCQRYNYAPSARYVGLCEKPKFSNHYFYDLHSNYINY